MMRSSAASCAFLSVRLSGRAAALLLGLGALVLTAPWIYQYGLGDPDSAAIAVGLFQAKLSGQGLQEPFLYAPELHTLYYLVLLDIVGKGLPYDAVAQLMNLVAWLSSAVNVILIFHLLHRICGAWGAALAVAMTLTSPVYFELSTYGHPVTLGTLALLLGTLALFHANSLPASRTMWHLGAAVLAWGLLTCSLLIRGDGFLLFPGLLALVFYLAGRKASMLTGAVMLLAILVFLGVHHLLATSGHSSGIFALATSYLVPDRQFVQRVLPYLPNLVAAAGLGTLGLIFSAAAFAAWRRVIPVLWVGACFLVPGVLAYLPSSVPTRHFYHLVVGAAFALGFFFSRLPRPLPPRLARALAAVVVALNLGLVVSLEWLLSGDFVDRHVNYRLRPIMTSVFTRHLGNERYHQWDEVRWNSMLRSDTRDTLFVGSWCDLVGLRQAIARAGHYHDVLVDQQWVDKKFATFRAVNKRLQFMQYYGDRPLRLPLTGEPVRRLVLLAEYPPKQLDSCLETASYHVSVNQWRY